MEEVIIMVNTAKEISVFNIRAVSIHRVTGFNKEDEIIIDNETREVDIIGRDLIDRASDKNVREFRGRHREKK